MNRYPVFVLASLLCLPAVASPPSQPDQARPNIVGGTEVADGSGASAAMAEVMGIRSLGVGARKSQRKKPLHQ